MSSVAPAVDVRLKSVLLAFDFSEASHKPLRHAIAIVRHYGAKFYLAPTPRIYAATGVTSIQTIESRNSRNLAETAISSCMQNS